MTYLVQSGVYPFVIQKNCPLFIDVWADISGQCWSHYIRSNKPYTSSCQPIPEPLNTLASSIHTDAVLKFLFKFARTRHWFTELNSTVLVFWEKAVSTFVNVTTRLHTQANLQLHIFWHHIVIVLWGIVSYFRTTAFSLLWTFIR